MLEFFPERRKSSTDLLSLPKASFFRRSPSPAKRSFSDLLNPFQRRPNDDSLYFIDKQEPFPKRPAKIFLSTKNKIYNNRNTSEYLQEVLQSYSSKINETETDDSYAFIDDLSTEIPAEMLDLQNQEQSGESKNRNEKSFIIWELLTSEIIYLKQIYFIFKVPLPILNQIKQQFFPKIDTFSIFGNLLEVLRSNVIFWTEYMENAFETLRTDGNIQDIKHVIEGFNNFSKHFATYKSYCMNISSNCEYISKLELESENFKQFLEWCRNSDSSNRLGLDTFITMPFQRLTRYSLFLERIVKECSEDSEIQQLTQAISEVDKFVNSINKSIKIKDLMSKLHYFQNILQGFPSIEDYMKAKFPIPSYPLFNLLCPMQVKAEYENEVRCLLHQDTMRLKQFHRKTIPVKVLLFTDLVIFAKPIKKNQQCRLQLIDHPITIDQLVIYDSHVMTENDQCLFLAEVNPFNCVSNIYKLSCDKNSTLKNSVKVFVKKFNFAKAHYEAIMLQHNKSNVHINVTNSDDTQFPKESISASSFKEEESCSHGNSAGHQSGSSSISDNESDADCSELSIKTFSSSSWMDFEITLNSCIIADPFINYFESVDTNDGQLQKSSYRYILQNYTDKFGRRKHDSVQSFSGEGSSLKMDPSLNLKRRSSLGNKNVIQTLRDND